MLNGVSRTFPSPYFFFKVVARKNEVLGLDVQIYSDALVVTKATYDKTNGLLPSTALGATGHVNPDKSPELRTFLFTYQTRFGNFSVDSFFASEGYDGVKIVAELLKRCGEDTDCARQTIISQPWNGVSGTFHFNDKGDADPIMGIVRIENGKQVYEYES